MILCQHKPDHSPSLVKIPGFLSPPDSPSLATIPAEASLPPALLLLAPLMSLESVLNFCLELTWLQVSSRDCSVTCSSSHVCLQCHHSRDALLHYPPPQFRAASPVMGCPCCPSSSPHSLPPCVSCLSCFRDQTPDKKQLPTLLGNAWDQWHEVVTLGPQIRKQGSGLWQGGRTARGRTCLSSSGA